MRLNVRGLTRKDAYRHGWRPQHGVAGGEFTPRLPREGGCAGWV